MKTLREILEQKETITSLIQKFGFSATVRIFFDCNRDPEGTETNKLILIITKDEEKILPWNNPTLLNVKLSSELKCEVSIIPLKAVSPLTEHYLFKNSVLLTDENALCQLFEITETDAVFFADTETPNPRVLQNANDYLSKLEDDEKKFSDAQAVSSHGLLSDLNSGSGQERELKKARAGSNGLRSPDKIDSSLKNTGGFKKN